MMLLIIFVPSKVKISKKVSALLSSNDFQIKTFKVKGHYSLLINVSGDVVLVLCTSSDHACICTKFHENISKGFRVTVLT